MEFRLPAVIRLLIALPIVALIAVATSWSASDAAAPAENANEQITAEEARGRARLLHEAIHATLQIVHREYYREDQALKIPAASMQQVFRELAKRQQVDLRWLAVSAQAMNPDHKPRDEFEREAVKAMVSGKDEHEQIDDGVYRLASTITLSSECLKCHLPTRTSNQDRAAGLIIAIPLKHSVPSQNPH